MNISRFLMVGVPALASLTLTSAAFAVGNQIVTGPGGITLPVLGSAANCGVYPDWGNVQHCLDNNEVTLGGMKGTVKAQEDATVDKEIFEPQCQLKFKVIQRGGDYASVFGWYPATEGATTPPQPKDMHVMLTCKDMQDPMKAQGVDWTDPVGTEKVLVVPPGTGKVGFFMANNAFDCAGLLAPDPAGGGGEVLAKYGTNTAYTQKALNKGPGGNYMVLQWQSKANPDAFYFGWEDNYEGTDNDFEDLLTMVTGVDCAEGGDPCDTPGIGICKPGTMQCRGGMLECVPDNDPTPERCNAIDDDCNGVTDDGDGLCPPNKVCIDGVCIGDCSSAEFPCPTGYVCVEGADTKFRCVEQVCENVTCAEGERCVGGQCIGDCKDVVCPWGQNCQSGKCVPACEGLVCDMGFVCVVHDEMKPARGVCETCPCKGCPDGTTCDTGYCKPNDCVGVVCAAGTHCVSGGCVDDCTGVVCPFNGTCAGGICSGGDGVGGASGSAGTGGTGGSGGTIDPVGGTGGTIDPVGGSGGTIDPVGGSGGDDPGGDPRRKTTTNGCACRTQGDADSRGAAWLIAALGLAVAARRSRRATQRS